MKGIVMALQTSRSIPDLFSDAVGQLAKLIGNEFELARAELSEKARMVGNAAALIGAGAVIMIPALVLPPRWFYACRQCLGKQNWYRSMRQETLPVPGIAAVTSSEESKI